MLHIREKSPAERENQAIDYLLHGENLPRNMHPYFIGILAMHLLAMKDLAEVKNSPEVHSHSRQATDQDLTSFANGFTQHLRARNRGSEEYERYINKGRMIARYNDEFAPLVAEIDFEDESELLAGSWAKPRILEKDGVEYIVRKIGLREGVDQVEKHIDAGLRIVDIPQMEHIVAISYKDCITVAPKLPGVSLKTLETSAIVKDVTAAQLREFVACMKLANERGVGFDDAGGNIFYDPVEGFSALDLEPLLEYGTTTWSYALMLEIEFLTKGPSNDLYHVYEIDRIRGIVETIFVEEKVDGVARMRLEDAGKRIADTIERLEMFEEFDKQDKLDGYPTAMFGGAEDESPIDD